MIKPADVKNLNNGLTIYGVSDNNYLRMLTFVGDIHNFSDKKYYALHDQHDNKMIKVAEDMFYPYFLSRKEAIEHALNSAKEDLEMETKRMQKRVQELTENLKEYQ